VSGTNGQGPGYRVGTTGPAEAAYLDITDRAIVAGVGHAVVEAMRQIRERLRIDPREFGEPMYRLPSMRMLVRCAAVGPLYVEYGVHDIERVVVIRRVRWLADPAG
jgi:hypothetical protein